MHQCFFFVTQHLHPFLSRLFLSNSVKKSAGILPVVLLNITSTRNKTSHACRIFQMLCDGTVLQQNGVIHKCLYLNFFYQKSRLNVQNIYITPINTFIIMNIHLYNTSRFTLINTAHLRINNPPLNARTFQPNLHAQD